MRASETRPGIGVPGEKAHPEIRWNPTEENPEIDLAHELEHARRLVSGTSLPVDERYLGGFRLSSEGRSRVGIAPLEELETSGIPHWRVTPEGLLIPWTAPNDPATHENAIRREQGLLPRRAYEYEFEPSRE